MKPHENALILIEAFNYNARQTAEVLEIDTRTASDKIKSKGYHKFTEPQFYKLLKHFQQVSENQNKILKNLTLTA